jgi:hypothetical protein
MQRATNSVREDAPARRIIIRTYELIVLGCMPSPLAT